MLNAHASESEVIFSPLKLSPKRCVQDIFRKSEYGDLLLEVTNLMTRKTSDKRNTFSPYVTMCSDVI